MWLVLPALAGVLGFVGYSKYKKAGGATGLGEKAGVEAAKALTSALADEAKKVYHVAIDTGMHPEKAYQAAKDAVNHLLEKL